MTVATSKVKPCQGAPTSCQHALDDLSAQLGGLLETGRHADVSICVGTEQIQAHSLILSARSPVFDAMLSHSMREHADKAVTITDLDPEAVRKMLRFMYQGRLDENLDIDKTMQLLQAAHKYQVSALVDLCVSSLTSRVTSANAADILMLADLIGHEAMKRQCLEIITRSSEMLANVQASDRFAQLSHKRPHLLVDILSSAFPPAKVAKKR